MPYLLSLVVFLMKEVESMAALYSSLVTAWSWASLIGKYALGILGILCMIKYLRSD